MAVLRNSDMRLLVLEIRCEAAGFLPGSGCVAASRVLRYIFPYMSCKFGVLRITAYGTKSKRYVNSCRVEKQVSQRRHGR